MMVAKGGRLGNIISLLKLPGRRRLGARTDSFYPSPTTHTRPRVVGVWAVASMIKYRQRIREPRGLRWYLGKELLPVIALSAIAAGVLFACLPKIDLSEVRLLHGFTPFEIVLGQPRSTHC